MLGRLAELQVKPIKVAGLLHDRLVFVHKHIIIDLWLSLVIQALEVLVKPLINLIEVNGSSRF